MRRFLFYACAASLFWFAATQVVRADMITSDPYPTVPERPASLQSRQRTGGIPTYSIAAGVVAVALTGSWIALRRIRKSRDNRTP